MHVNPVGPGDGIHKPNDRVRLVGVGPGSFKICENPNTATITPTDFRIILFDGNQKQKFFDAVFELLEQEKEVIVSFGTSPNAITNYLSTELASSDTVEYLDCEYGLEVEVKKNDEKGLASLVTIKKLGYSKNHIDPTNEAHVGPTASYTHDDSEDFNPDDTGGGLLDADDEKGESPGFLQTEWDSLGANSYSRQASSRPSFFEEHYLDSDETANFNKINIAPYSSDFVLDNTLNALLTQVVKHKRVINIPQDNSKQKYDPKGLFIYLNKKTKEIHIILNGKKNANDEMLQSVVLSPIIVHFLKNNYTVVLNYGFEDRGALNYEVQTGQLFNLIDSKYNVETGFNITSEVQERQEGDTIFTFTVIKGQKS